MKKYFTYVTLGMLLLSITAAGVAVGDSEPEIEEPLLIAEKIAGEGYYQDMIYPEDTRENVPLYIDPGYSYLTIKPGESDEMTVTLYNYGKDTINVEPRLVPKFFNDDKLDDEWVSISPSKAEIESEKTQEFTIKVSVPEDAELGHYSSNIFFSGPEDEIATPYPGYNGMFDLSVNVWLPPNVQVFNSHISDRVEAGSEYEYVIKLKNVADKPISIDPEFEESDEEWYYRSQISLEEKDVTITAPSVIEAEEKAIVKVKISIPDDAEGGINGIINLNIKDRTISEWGQKINMNFDVWQQPDEAYRTTFNTMTDGPITIKVFSVEYNYGSSSISSTTPSFDVVLRNDDGEAKPVLLSSSYSGSVSIGQESPVIYRRAMEEAAGNYIETEVPVSEDLEQLAVYQDTSTGYTEIYHVDGSVGEWTLEIMPHNTETFEYMIDIGPSE